MALFFILLCGWIWQRGKIPFLLGLSGAAAFCGMSALAFLVEFSMEKTRGHVRFAPVPIRNLFPGWSLFPRSAAPFALAAVAALIVPPLLPGSGSAVSGLQEAQPFLITAAEYEAHADFQASFSFRSLNGQEEAHLPDTPYLRYALGEDGLIREISETPALPEAAPGSFPPFPLEGLTRFLGEAGQELPSREEEYFWGALMGVLAIPALIPRFRRRGKPGVFLVYHDKRIAA
jgi:hypothetical protein